MANPYSHNCKNITNIQVRYDRRIQLWSLLVFQGCADLEFDRG